MLSPVNPENQPSFKPPAEPPRIASFGPPTAPPWIESTTPGTVPAGQQPYTNPVAPVAYTERPQGKTTTTGRVALITVGIALLAGLIAAVIIGMQLADWVTANGTANIDASNIPASLSASISQIGVVLNIASWIGTVGFVTAIVATATNRGRKMGIAGIVVAVCSPILVGIVMVAVMMPAIAAVS